MHVVDPRKQPAISSAYADSQSFEIAKKLSHDEIIEREKHGAGVLLDRLLSKEASRLNFPLRVNTIIETDSLVNKLSEELNPDELSLFIISSELGGTILHDLDEFFEITNSFNSLSLIIPPGYQFSVPEKVFILYDFESTIHDSIFKVMDSLKVFKPLVNVADVIEEQNNVKYIEMEIKSTAWQQLATQHAGPGIRVATNILMGKQYTETVLNFVKRNNYDLVAIPKNIKDPANSNIFSKHVSKQLIDQLEIPVILY
jgi:hypothetical protein